MSKSRYQSRLTKTCVYCGQTILVPDQRCTELGEGMVCEPDGRGNS